MKLNDRTDAYSAALAGELRRLREEAGLSKNRLAEMAGLSQQMVSYVEKQTRIPTTASLYRIAQALGTSPGAILTSVDMAWEHAHPKHRTEVIQYPTESRDKGATLVAEDSPKRPATPKSKTKVRK